MYINEGGHTLSRTPTVFSQEIEVGFYDYGMAYMVSKVSILLSTLWSQQQFK